MKKYIILMLLTFPLFSMAQKPETRTIKGQVLDEQTKLPLIGATIFFDPEDVAGHGFTPEGTSNDAAGKFELVVPKGLKTVIVSYLGYHDVKLDIVGKDTFTISLKESSNTLDEVVVTGYQKIEKRKVTSSIAKVDMGDLKRIGVSSVDQLLEGQLAGVMSSPTSGAPGAPNKIRIRSTVSLSGSTDPLWVIDGIPLEGNDVPSNFDKDNIDNLMNTSIAGFNPEDIQDITILKDAAATAIYGARAANGVIVVTTKKGVKGKLKANISAATFVSQRPNLGKLNLMNASEKVDFELGMANRSDLDFRSEYGEVSRIIGSDMALYRKSGLSALSPEKQNAINALRSSGSNWGNEIYRMSINQQYNASLSGGSDLARYYFSAGYFNEQGTTRGTGYDRLNLTLKTDFSLAKNLVLGVAMYGVESKRKSYITDTDANTNPSRYSRSVNPYLNARDANGNYVYDKDIQGYSGRHVDFSYLEEMANTNYELKNRSLKTNFDLNYKVTDWLNLSTMLGLQIENNSTDKQADKSTYYARKYREKSLEKGQYFLPEGGVIQDWNSDFFQYYWKAQADFSKRFNDVHELDLMLGMELRANKNQEVHTKGFGFDAKSLTTKPVYFPAGSTAGNQAEFQQYKKSFSENRFMSYFMTGSYTYDNRYTVFGSIRYDGSDLFGVSNKYRYLPLWSLSGAWNINREEFMKDADWVSNLKLRLSYGLQGNIDKQTSPQVVGEWGNVTILPGVNEPIITVTSPPNQYLRWEKTANWNLGLDMAFLDNRISASVDLYNRVSSDLIGLKTLPGENGFDFSTVNWAQVTNNGFEVSLSTVNIKSKNFRWATDFNFAHNKSRVDKITSRDNSYQPSLQGYAIGAQFALPYAGPDDKGIPTFWREGKKVSMQDFFGLYKGGFGGEELLSSLSNAEFKNLFQYIGNSEPKFTGGMINRFYYKNFDLAISASFTIDQTMKRDPFYKPTETSPGENYSRDILDVWSPTNTGGKYPALINSKTDAMAYNWLQVGDPSNSFSKYDIWYKKMSYVRINSIRLGYKLPENVLRKLNIADARFSLEMRNPLVFGSNYDGYFDPETYGSIYAQPLAKTISLGFNLSF